MVSDFPDDGHVGVGTVETSSKNNCKQVKQGGQHSSTLNCSGQDRIMVVGDSQSRGSSAILKDYIRNGSIIETIVKPGAVFESVIEDLKKLTASFTKNDCVIVIAGTNNILSGQKLNKETVKDLMTELCHTRCLFVSVPFFSNNKLFNMCVNIFNSDLNDCICSFQCNDFRFIDIHSILSSDFSRSSLHLTKAEKRRLLFHIAINILEYRAVVSRFSVNKDHVDSTCDVNNCSKDRDDTNSNFTGVLPKLTCK